MVKVIEICRMVSISLILAGYVPDDGRKNVPKVELSQIHFLSKLRGRSFQFLLWRDPPDTDISEPGSRIEISVIGNHFVTLAVCICHGGSDYRKTAVAICSENLCGGSQVFSVSAASRLEIGVNGNAQRFIAEDGEGPRSLAAGE